MKWSVLLFGILFSAQVALGANPILLVTSGGNAFTSYYAEILRAEGLNAFDSADISALSASTLSSYDVAIVGEMPLTPNQVTMITSWVNSGGNLIAMRPDKQLAPLLGISDIGTALSGGYLLVNTSTGPGSGIVGQTIQFHGTADQYASNGATTLATLYSSATASTPYPAVSLRTAIGSGGKAAAFTYDLARSVVYTRQGNPAWAGQARTGQDGPIRSVDMFYGAASFDPQPDWVDLNKVAIPQADEQQRLLANLILSMNQTKKPLPRFWYFPFGLKAAVIMTGDDHALGGTAGRFDDMVGRSTAGCSVANWECVRGTSYVYANNPLTDSQAASYTAQGFEVGVHVTTNCTDFDPSTLESFFSTQLVTFASQYPSISAPQTNRTHCIAWSDWSTHAQVELNHGIRLDTNYYYWPESWVQNRAGMFTGSGMPMRFAQTDGTLIDVYQAVTQMPDESGEVFPGFINSLLDNAVGSAGYYGAFTTNMHNDYNNCGTSCPDGHASEVWTLQIVDSAKAHGVPVISAKQMLQWLDGRNGSSFGSLSWIGNVLSFTVTAAPAANGLQAMLPTISPAGALSSITAGGLPVSYSVQTIKGVDYAFFAATSGAYQATYGSALPPVITGVTATAGSTTETITWTTDKPASSRVDYGTSPSALAFSAQDGALVTNHSVSLTGLALGVTYYFRATSIDASGTSATSPSTSGSPASFTTIDLTPPSIAALNAIPAGSGMTSITWTTNKPTSSRVDFGLSPSALNQNQSDATMLTAHGIGLAGLITGTTYYYRATSVDALGNTVTSPAAPNPPATFVQNSVSVWNSGAVPAIVDSLDPGSVELGMKFRSDVPGLMTGVRFYKSAANTGTHVGNLWTSTGTLLGSAVFNNETASGWQQANFAAPISINANTTYIVSYFAPNGHYSATFAFFNAGVDNSPLHALASGIDGPNGIFVYSPASCFPTSTANNNNYWVDAVFTDNTPPVISSVSVILNDSSSARVIWTTDKPASSTVNYGTSPASLTLSASTGGASTSHSVTLTGLTLNTTYYYQVISAALAGSATAPASPASFLMLATVGDSVLSNFVGGTGTCSSVAQGSGGAVILTPAVDAEFTSSSLPSGWVSNIWSAPGAFTFDGSAVNVDGAVVASSTAYPAGSSLEFMATFSGQPFQHVGLTLDPNFDPPWIMFSTGATGNAVYARISDLPDVLIPGNWLGAPHLYRIDWTATGVTFSIDGTVVSVQSTVVTANLVLVASDLTPGGGTLSVNWMRLSPYAASCSFLSRILDAGTPVAWNSMSWVTSTTPGSSVIMSYRTGNTPLPDASWTSFTTLSASGAALAGGSRYIQYGANLATTDATKTPALQSVSITYGPALSPSITTQPASTTINNGQTTNLTVGATGTPTLNFQWFSGTSGDTSQPIAGATVSTFTTPALTATKNYWVRVSNSAGSANSATATVTVNRAASSTSLTASPNPSVAGQTLTLSARVTAGATGSVTFLDGSTTLGTAALSSGTASLSTSQLGVGSHSLTASYSGDPNFTASTSIIVPQVVNAATTKATLTASPNLSVSGQSVILSATISVVAPGVGTVTGSVTFKDGTTVLGTATLSGGVASLAVTTFAGGSHSLTATYTANGNFAGSTSTAVTETVNAASTTTALSSAANPSVFGQSVTLTATVSPIAPGAGIVNGSVTFKDGTTVLGTSTLSGGSATLPATTLAVGSHSLTASFAATSSYAASTSTALTQTVKQDSTTTTFTISPATSVSGQSVTLTATVTPVAPGAGIPTGTLSLLSGGTVLGSATLSGGTVSTVVSTIPVGSYTFTLSYGGDANFTASSSALATATVNQASTTTILSAAPNPSVPGQPVILTATVAVVSPGTGTATGSVTFTDGTTTLATTTLTNGIATLSVSNLALGSHSIKASYAGSTSFKTSASAAITQAVNPASTTTKLTTSLNPSTLAQSVTLTASVTPVAPGTGTATGTLTFKDGTTVLGTATLASGNATLVVSNLALGAHSLTATYGGATNFLTSTSPVVTQTVNQPSTTSALTATPNPSIVGQTVTLKATVGVVAPGTGTPTGTVTFKDGSTTLGTATLSAGTGSLTISTLSMGAHSLTVVYGGATNFAGSTSSVVTQTVNLPSTTTVLTSNLNPSVYGQSTTLKAVVSPVSPGTGTPTGTVTFKDGSTVVGTATLSGGAAITAISTLTGGSHALTAVYAGNTSFVGSTSSAVTQTVNRASTATALNVSPLTSVFGQPVTLTATISSSSNSMTGTVTFKDGSTVVGTANISGNTASLAVTTLSPAIHLLTATYGGDTNYSSSTSSTGLNLVNQASTTAKVVPSTNPSAFGQSVTLVATISPVAPGSGVPTGSVTFKDGGGSLGTVNLSGGSASLAISSLAVGNHSITVVYNDDSNFGTSTSPPVTEVVQPASTSSVLTATPNPSNFGQAVTFKATVSALAPGAGTPTGSVVFKDGSSTIGTVSLSSGAASFSTTSLSRASHTITAAYQGSGNYSASTSTAVTQTVR